VTSAQDGDPTKDGNPSVSAVDNAEPSAEPVDSNQEPPNLAGSGVALEDEAITHDDVTPVPDENASGGKPPITPPAAIYSQQLWEVQLLLDFLSGNPTHKLPDPSNAKSAGLPDDWIEQICKMTWPPSGTPVQQADQEALLVRVKDYLNGMAAPASGFSVAFTLLVTQEDGSGEHTSRRRKSADNPDPSNSRTTPGMAESRGSLARKAYPDLSRKARAFRRGMEWIAISLAAWLLFTCFLSWYLTYGNSELGQLATAQSAFDAVQVKIAAAANAESTASPTTTNTQQTTPIAVNPAIRAAATSGVTYCEQPALLGTKISPSRKRLQLYVSPTQADVCQAYDKSKANLESAETNIQHWLPFQGTRDKGSGPVYRATAIVSMLGTAILPVCYGILGAAAAVLRLLSRRMRLSLLTPRDLSLSLQQLALGAVIGACIGLFVASPGSGGQSTTELLGPVSLSGSALSFIAGFGVDSVFSALEALIARIFNTAPAPSK
jgi:hypothetical protein